MRAVKLVTQLALGYPEVGMVLRSGDRELLEAPPARSASDRFFQIYRQRPDLVAVAREAAGIRVQGYVATRRTGTRCPAVRARLSSRSVT